MNEGPSGDSSGMLSAVGSSPLQRIYAMVIAQPQELKHYEMVLYL